MRIVYAPAPTVICVFSSIFIPICYSKNALAALIKRGWPAGTVYYSDSVRASSASASLRN